MFRESSWRPLAILLVVCLVFPWGNANHEKSKYSKESNTEWDNLLRRIETNLAEYRECDHDHCRCHQAVIMSDLEPYQQVGVTQAMVEESRQHGVLYQIIDHQLYREEECMFEFRCRGVEHFLQLLKDQLADGELVVNTRDWPMVRRGRRLPVFSFSKTSEYGDITYPAWTFWQGGPAISLYPMGIGRWDQHRVSISEAAERTPWKKKRDVAFFRGSRTSSERDSLVLLGRHRPELVDAQYTRNQAWKSDADTLGAPAAKEVSFEDHCRYKYLFNFRGVAASFRFKHLFLCGSLVFHVGDEWTEFFYSQLKPWVHYISVPSHPSEEQIVQLLEFARQNDVTVREIAQRGRQFIMDNLRMEDVTCYWRKLLRAYTKLLQYKPEKRDNLTLVPERN